MGAASLTVGLARIQNEYNAHFFNSEGPPLVTLANLRSQSSRELAQLAKTTGIAGWHQMRKEQLIQALIKSLKKRGQIEMGPAAGRVKRSLENSVPRTPIKTGSKTGLKTAGKNSKVNGTSAVNKSQAKATDSIKSGDRTNGKSNGVKSPVVAKNGNGKAPSKMEASRRKSTGATVVPKLNGHSHEYTNGYSEIAVPPASAIASQIQKENERREELKNLALSALVAKENRTVAKDRLILIVRDSHWLQTYWEITEATVRRARAALEKNWRGAKPVLRLLEIVDEGDGPTEVVRREIEIHSGVDTWYIDSGMPSRTYRVMIGYLAHQGRFFALAKSNKVTTPSPGTPAPQDHWAEIANQYESYFAMSGGFNDDNESRDLQDVFEEKLRRPVKTVNPEHVRMGDYRSDFRFEVDAQMVIFGIADPGAVVTVGGEPLRIEENGTFSIRVDMPDKRQVFPVVACSRDGAHQRTTVLAVERNTKVMDPVHMESDEA